jgi:beta-glucuronidase
VVRNRSRTRQAVPVLARVAGATHTLGRVTLAPGRTARVRRAVRIDQPRLWSPRDPHLYEVEVGAGSTVYRLRTGLRSVGVSGGRLRLNGQPLRFRGVGYHEDRAGKGSALGSADRRWLVDEARAVGADLMRTHYPPHPHLHELADAAGVMLWSEIPVYQMANSHLLKKGVRRKAVRLLRDNVLANGNHPSVIVWSLANELTPTTGTGQTAYFREATRAARRLDPTRPAALAVAGWPSVPCQRAYDPVPVIGINQYYGWYPGPDGETMDRHRLSSYLDQVRACYPAKALAVTEFGAEANRDGPPEEKGTWQFQREFVDHHLGVFATKDWLSGVSYWALNEFWIRSGWSGGNPRPDLAPVHQKGLITYAGQRKPAWEDLRRWFSGGAGT